MPTIASPLELREGMEANFNCSTPYSCLQEPVHLQWQGQDPARSVTSHHEKLEPTGVSNQETLHMVLSWQDHGRTLSCQLSVAKYKTKGEILLQVQCECPGHTFLTEHTSVAPQWKPPLETGSFSSPQKQGPRPCGIAGCTLTSWERTKHKEPH